MSEAASNILRWRRDPVAFVRELFNVEPDGWQILALRAFARGDTRILRVALRACAGPGKTAVLAWMGWNFLQCYGDVHEHPKGACVSITEDNLKDNLWSEFAKWQNHSPMLLRAFVWQKERIFARDHPETWFLSARAYAKKADPETQGQTLSGIHSKYVAFFIDESGDIPPAVGRSADQALSRCDWGRIIQAGNPTSREGMLYTAATTQKHMWETIRITGDPDDPNRSHRIDIEWARQQIGLYGRDNPWVMAYILGLFPPTSINQLMGPDDVEKAMSRILSLDAYAYVQKRLGIDVAREGDDRTILFPRQGLASFKYAEMRNAKGYEVAARAALARSKFRQELDFVDDTGGWGGAVIEAMNMAGLSPIPVNFSGKADDPRYLNKRAEMWFRMKEWVERGGALPNDAQLARELTAPTYTFHNGKFQLEDKDQIKRRLKFSPDAADALALTFALVDMPASDAPMEVTAGRKTAHAESEYDPFDGKN